MKFLKNSFPAGLILALLFSLSGPPLYCRMDGDGWSSYLPGLRYQFDRADKETDPEQWLREARKGIEATAAGWECFALEWFGDPEMRDAARESFLQKSDEELERRFTRWLFDCFFRDENERFQAQASLEVLNAGTNLLYHRDGEGNILLDPETGDPLLIRPHEETGETGINEWKRIVYETIDLQREGYASYLAEKMPELLAYIPPEDRERFSGILQEAAEAQVFSLQKELTALQAREERLFRARRVGDMYSLRKKSEGEAANLVTAQIIEEARAACEEGLAVLKTRIESPDAEGGNLSLEGAEWLAQYNEQFERGLRAWEEAEERFYVSRLEWELQTGTLFSESEKAWEEAFQQFTLEKEQWEMKALELFESGEAVFRKALEDMSRSVNEAREEFERDAWIRINAQAAALESWITTYRVCGDVMKSAIKSAEFWIKNYTSEFMSNSFSDLWVRVKADEHLLLIAENSIPPFPGEEFDKWLTEEISFCQEYALTKSLDTLKELEQWSAIYEEYHKKTLEVKKVLLEEYETVLGMDRLKDILKEGAFSDDFYLDEYQTELIRAQASVEYWEKRVQIAEAVLEYAEDVSAGRVTEGEGMVLWEHAKAAYEESVAEYDRLLEELSRVGEETFTIKQEIERLTGLMDESNQTIQSLTKELKDIMALYETQRTDMVKSELDNILKQITEINTLLSKTGADSVYASLLQDLHARNQWEELAEEIENLERLVNGEEGEPSLADLARQAQAAAEAAAAMKEEEEEADPGDVDLDALQEEALRTQGLLEERLVSISALRRDIPAERNFFLGQLTDFFSSRCILLPDSPMPDPKAIVDDVFSKNEDAGKGISELLIELDEMMEGLPRWVEEEYDSWKVSFIDYAAAKAAAIGKIVGGRVSELLEQIKALQTDQQSYDDNSGFEEDPDEEAKKKELMALMYEYQFCTLIEQTDEEGDKHWRQVIKKTEDIETDPEGDISKMKSADTLKDALLADFYNQSERATQRFNDALTIYIDEETTEEREAFYEKISAWIEDPLLEWDDDLTTEKDKTLDMRIEKSQEEIAYYRSTESNLEARVPELAALIELFDQKRDVLKQEIKNQQEKVDEATGEYENLFHLYEAQCDDFQEKGFLYEGIYKDVKTQYARMLERDLEYQKQDALRRWASTAYLYPHSEPAAETRSGEGSPLDSGTGQDINPDRSPGEELVYARACLERALEVRERLECLYGDAEKRRPFEDAGMDSLLETFTEDYANLLFVTKVNDALNRRIELEQAVNEEKYKEYLNVLSRIEAPVTMDESYVSPESRWYWNILDIIKNENGTLKFAFDSDFNLTSDNTENIESLKEYFGTKNQVQGEPNKATDFETALRDFGNYIVQRGFDVNSFLNWGLARDFLIRMMIASNPQIAYLNGQYHPSMALSGYGILGQLSTRAIYGFAGISFGGKKTLESYNYEYQPTLWTQQMAAYLSLSPQDREAMEFYTILCLLGGGITPEYFGRVSEYFELKNVRDISVAGADVNGFIRKFRKGYYSELVFTRDRTEIAYIEILFNMYLSTIDFASTMVDFVTALGEYQDSCKELAAVKGERQDGGDITWDEIGCALSKIGDLTAEEIEKIKCLWDDLINEEGGQYKNASDAVTDIMKRLYAKKNKTQESMEQYFMEKETGRLYREQEYRAAGSRYTYGTMDRVDFIQSLEGVYDRESSAEKTYLENLGSVITGGLGYIIDDRVFNTQIFDIVSEDYLMLMSRLSTSRFQEELAAREAIWGIQIQGILDRYESWRNTASLILERGERDWEESRERLNQSYIRWRKNFENEYRDASADWDRALLGGLLEKEAWVARAEDAALRGSDAAMLALLASDAEAAARYMDTVHPFSTLQAFTAEDAGLLLDEFLSTAGISGMERAFKSINEVNLSAETRILRGLGGNGLWSKSAARGEAQRFAQEASAVITERETKIIAANVRTLAAEALKQLEEMVRRSNQGVRDNMDNMFILYGQFNRIGMDYGKDALVHSTLFRRIITEWAFVLGYQDYLMPSGLSLPDLSDERLKNFNSLAIEGLIRSVYDDIAKLQTRIFGDGKGDEEGSPGEFGLHLGDPPQWAGDMGRGELGRLVGAFNYWNTKEQNGVATLSLPWYSKTLWDDRGSWFKSPSVRKVVDTAVSVVTIAAGAAGAMFTGGTSFIGSVALAAALNTVDDLAFNALDVGYGQKTWGEFAFDTGKTFAISAASSAVGGVSGGLTGKLAGKTATTLGKYAVNGLGTGLQALTTGTVTGALSALNYNSREGWSYSTDVLKESVIGGGKAALTGMTSFGVSSLLNRGLQGFTDKLYQDGTTLSSLTGGVAGQGLNYALEGDITLNLANLGDVFGRERINSGLLEMHLGRDGLSMNLGTGGVNASLGTLAGAARGLEAWKVNLELLASEQEEAWDYASALRTLYSSGLKGEYGSILAGETNILTWNREETQSKYDEVTGKKAIYLGTTAREDTSRFGLNVVLAHEAYRNGKNDGSLGQLLETDAAVEGHIQVANSILDTYGIGSLTTRQTLEAYAYRMAEAGQYDLAVDLFNSYDSSEDYWKLVQDASGIWGFIDDNRADFDISDFTTYMETKRPRGYNNQVYKDLLAVLQDSSLQDGKETGIISAGRMTDEVAETLAMSISGTYPLRLDYFEGPDHTRLFGFVTEGQWIDDTKEDILEKMNYNYLHTTTVQDPKKHPITLWKADSVNKAAGTIPKQKDEAFKENSVIGKSGCNFMDIIALPQFLTQTLLSNDKILEIWDKSIQAGVMEDNGYVSNPDKISDLALEALERTDIGLSYGYNYGGRGALAGYRVKVPYNKNGEEWHFVLGGLDKKTIYNPGNTDNADKRIYTDIYVYGK